MYTYILSFCAFRKRYDAIEVTAPVYLSSSYINKKVPYKYFVQYFTGTLYLEYIRDLPVNDICNRCLELGNQTVAEKGNLSS